MIRLVGLALVWGGCALWGAKRARRVRGCVHVLEDMGWALEVLERELTLNRTGVPELLEQLAQQGKGGCAAIFSCCAAGMKVGVGFAPAWRAALEQSELVGEDRQLLSGLSAVLGRYDAMGQGQALEHLRREVERRCSRQREQARVMGRVYTSLGLTAGGFLALTLY